MDYHQIDLSNTSSAQIDFTFKSQTSQNKELRELFALRLKLPEWSNSFCYWLKEPEHHERMVNWNEICDKFGLKRGYRKVLKGLYGKADHTGLLAYESMVAIIPNKNRFRTLNALYVADVLSQRGPDLFCINPSIMWGKEWWSPAAQGILAVTWMNGELVTFPRLNKLRDIYKMSMEFGCEWASQTK
jgi:hypothetical protein